MLSRIIRFMLKILSDDVLCLVHEDSFEEMRNRKFIIYEDELNK